MTIKSITQIRTSRLQIAKSEKQKQEKDKMSLCLSNLTPRHEEYGGAAV
jgi:hypothetical protein